MRLRHPRALADEDPLSKPFTVARDGFSINAAVVCEAHERTKLERVCRYMARPAIAEARLNVDDDGLVVYELKRPFADGTTHVLFEPIDFIARLAARVPRPRAHLIRYHGVFAPNASYRRLIVPRHASPSSAKQSDNTTEAPGAPMRWMARLYRVFSIDLSRCPKCVTFLLDGNSIEFDAVVIWRIVRGKIAEAWDIPAVNTVRTIYGDSSGSEP